MEQELVLKITLLQKLRRRYSGYVKGIVWLLFTVSTLRYSQGCVTIHSVIPAQ